MSFGPAIAILTDFGAQDPFVGIMKGVIAQIAPGARTIDLTHEIPPGDLRRAGVQLWLARPFFPPATVFLAVVDPGVGSARRGLIAEDKGAIFIGPDNGLLTFVLGGTARIFELAEPAFQLSRPSATFHGRDIFAPAAAHAAVGIDPKKFGPAINQPVRLPAPVLQMAAGAEVRQVRPEDHSEGDLYIQGEVLYPDRFGNLLTSLGRISPSGPDLRLAPWLPGANFQPIQFEQQQGEVLLARGGRLPWVRTFSEITAGETGALVGSAGLIEIAARGASAAQQLGLVGGESVYLRIRSAL